MRFFGYELSVRRSEAAALASAGQEGRTSIENPATPSSQVLDIVTAGARTTSGLLVDEARAANYTTVYACVSLIAKTIAGLPLQIYESVDKGEKLASKHYLWPLLHDAPNEYMTSFVWREACQATSLLWGNACSRIEYDSRGRITALLPLRPGRMRPRLEANGRLRYELQTERGGIEYYAAEEILHIPALSFDGLWGLSPIAKLRNAIGLGLAAEEYGARLFENDARPGIVVELAGKLSPQAEANLKADINEKYKGLGNRHKAMVLEQGVKIHEVGFPPEDAQFLDTRKLQRNEICSGYGVPPAMIGDLERAIFSNSESQDLWFAKHTMLPWCLRWEQEINRKLFADTPYFVKFNLDGLMRGDFKTRMEGLVAATGGPFMLRSEARELQGLKPVDGFDFPLMPLNMGDATNPPDPNAGNKPASQP